LKKPFFLIKEINLGVKKEIERFEPLDYRRKTAELSTRRTVWGPGLDAIRTYFAH
jgi:hypothetical protein